MLKFYTYKLPFRQPFRTADKTYDHREGIILHYKEADLDAYGEIAPLPGFSEESLEQVIPILRIQQDHLQNALQQRDTEDLFRLLDSIHSFPSLSFGLDMLWSDLQAKEKGISISQLIADQTGFNTGTIRVNFTSGIKAPEEVLKQVSEKTGKGFDTIKLKAGKDLQLLRQTLGQIRNNYPDLKIRLDANGAWSEKEALSILKELSNYSVEYCEQPVPAGSEDILARVAKESPIPIAADESIRNISDAKRLSEEHSTKLFIIKPMFFGRIKDIIVTKQMADSHNIRLVFTTALESAIGRKAVGELASVLGNKNLAHGLDTGSFFLNDLSEKMVISNGSYTPDELPGLGMNPDASLLNQI